MERTRRASTGSSPQDGNAPKRQASILSFLTKPTAKRHSDNSSLNPNAKLDDSLPLPQKGLKNLNQPSKEFTSSTNNFVKPDDPSIHLQSLEASQVDLFNVSKSDETSVKIEANNSILFDSDSDGLTRDQKRRRLVKPSQKLLFDSEDEDAIEKIVSQPGIVPIKENDENGNKHNIMNPTINEISAYSQFSYIDKLSHQPKITIPINNGFKHESKEIIYKIKPERNQIKQPRTKEEEKATMLTSYAAKNYPSFFEYVNNYYNYCENFGFPPWVDPINLKDANLNDPFTEKYDYTSLWIPPLSHPWAKSTEYRQHLTPCMQQYWDVKSKHFEKIILFKLGRFYEVFYSDACVAQRVCDLKWMGGEHKPHVGFPEQSLHYHAKKLVRQGYKVVIVEQMETPKELEERNRNNSGPKDKAVHREVCELYSQGTLLHDDMLDTQPQYLMVVYFEDSQHSNLMIKSESEVMSSSFGVCIVDVATCNFFLGHFQDYPSRLTFKTLCTQILPSEIVYSTINIPSEALQIIKNSPMAPQLSPLVNFPVGISANEEFELYSENLKNHSTAYELIRDNSCCLNAYAATCRYLRNNLLDQKVLNFAHFELYQPFNQKYLIMDSAALKNLEILQTSDCNVKNSLFGFLNHTSTSFGSRLFRRWTCSPLYSAAEINQRLDCVEWFINNFEITKAIIKKLKKLPDVERLLSHVCIKGLQGERGAVYFDNIQHKRLDEFISLLNAFDSIEEILSTELRSSDETDTLPFRLVNLIKREEEGGLCPNLSDLNNSLRDKIDLTDEKTPKPKMGFEETHDSSILKIRDIQNELEAHLDELIKTTRQSSLKFVHSKFKYEVEAPDNISKSFQQSVEITSTKKGFIRFHTEEIKELITELDEAEQAQKDSIFPFMKKLFNTFYVHYSEYQKLYRIIAEIDCLISLAMVQLTSPTKMCKPEFIEYDQSSNFGPQLILENCRHPVVSQTISNFIPNDMKINCNEIQASTILVTGPNMGGKSTVLRQTCIAIIMAQMGCFVAADRCLMTPVDRIFTRIGAHDLILEGKSTFFVELEETCSILRQATSKSFVIIDELGRGTSTFDGTAIAMAALEYIANTIKCRCLFSTHFHLLCEEFRLYSSIINFHMAANVDKGNVTFLYKLIEGSCPKSHGAHIARLAGIPEEVLECAAEKSVELEKITREFHMIARYRNISKELINYFGMGNINAIKNLYELYKQDINQASLTI